MRFQKTAPTIVAGSLVDRISGRVPGWMLRRVLRLEHRGWWHSGYVALVWGVVAGLVGGVWWGLGMALGFFSHLLADRFTFSGVRIFRGRKRWGPGYPSGAWGESVAAVVFLGLCGGFWVWIGH